jgi:hypothetical protein
VPIRHPLSTVFKNNFYSPSTLWMFFRLSKQAVRSSLMGSLYRSISIRRTPGIGSRCQIKTEVRTLLLIAFSSLCANELSRCRISSQRMRGCRLLLVTAEVLQSLGGGTSKMHSEASTCCYGYATAFHPYTEHRMPPATYSR